MTQPVTTYPSNRQGTTNNKTISQCLLCPNPKCSNKPFRSIIDLKRHMTQRPKCQAHFMAHCKSRNQIHYKNALSTDIPNLPLNRQAFDTSSVLSIHQPTPEEIEMFNSTPIAEDYDMPFSDDISTFESSADDFLIIPTDTILFTEEMRIETSLLRLCLDIGAPLWAFEEIMKWAHDAYQSGYMFSPKQKRYESQVNKLKRWLNMEYMTPIIKEVILPTSNEAHPEQPNIVLIGNKIPVTTFDFKTQVHSLLSDPKLNHLDNLVLNDTDPFSQYSPPDGKLGESLSGSWYRTAWQHMEDNQLGNFLCPVILYIDKTQLSISGKLSLFPVMMSLGIFTAAARRKSNAWRPLGYISNEAVHFSKDQRKENDANIKNARVHTILQCILQSFKEAQLPGALRNMKLQLGIHIRVCDMYMPLQFIIGDVEAGDMLCSRYYYRQLQCPRLCRTCDVSTINAGNTDIQCNRILLTDVKQLVANHDYEALHAIAQRPTFNCLYDIDCGNDPYGVFSMIHSEGLHAIEIGLIPYMLEILLDEIKPKTSFAQLDLLVQRLHHEPRQHGYTNFPRCIWPDGVTSLTQLSGMEKVGKMFAITLAAMTLEGEIYFTQVLPGGSRTWRRMLYCFQQILCYWAWLKQDTFWLVNDVAACEEATKSIKIMMKQIQVLWPRKEGLLWNLTKLHEQFHIPVDICRQGAHINVHTGPQEHNHLDQKRAAQNTQRQKKSIDLQTGLRVMDRLIIQRGYDMLTEQLQQSRQVMPEDRNGISSVSSKGYIIILHKNNQNQNSMEGELIWDNSKYNQYPVRHYNYIFSLLTKTYFDSHNHQFQDDQGLTVRKLRIRVFSEYARHNVLYRSHPHYRSQHPHYDWSYVRFYNGEDPITKEERHVDMISQILLFYEHPNDQSIHAIIHSVDWQTQSPHGVYGTYWHMESEGPLRNLRPRLYSVSVDCLDRHAMMIRYKENDDNKWIQIWDQADWPKCFQSIETNV